MTLIAISLVVSAHAAVDPYLILSTPTNSEGQVQLPLTGESSADYVIESSTDLTNWTAVATNSSEGIDRVVTLDSGTNEATFYRA